MRLDGTLKTWNDDRGFGFIEPAHGGQDIFVHIKAFPAGTGRPQAGQALTFRVTQGADGRKRAFDVQYPVRMRARRSARDESPAPWSVSRALAIPLFAALAFVVARRWGLAPSVIALYVVLSVVTFLAYAFDKAAAVERRRRTAESTLLVLGLAGGWPGALLAQQLLRHKTTKPSFVVNFWITVVLNVAVFVAWQARGLEWLWLRVAS
jgi:uncharacterized membrane protein YsdA (DUF1294 family)/cold shock CspA family protein